MPIRINTRELLEILALTPRGQNILLIGKHGIGKSQILSRYYTDHGLRVVALFLGQMSDPGDVLGLPTRAEDGCTRFLPPAWWPVDGRPVALFLDELNRARPELLQSVHDLALNRSLAGRELPPGSVVLAAANIGDEYQLTDLDPALLSRFNVYEFVPEVEEWLSWARQEQLDPRVVSFIEAHGSFLDGAPGSGGEPMEKVPDRRAWTRVAALIGPHQALSPLLVKAVAGIVGAPAALSLGKFASAAQRITPEALLLHFDEPLARELLALQLPDAVHLGRQTLAWVEEQAAQRMAPGRRQKILAGFENYVRFLRQGGKTELLADLINRIESGDLTHASAMLLAAPQIMKTLTDYIARVRL